MKKLLIAFIANILFITNLYAVNLSVTVDADKRAATAAAAKRDATNSATRSAALIVLSRYASRYMVESALANMDDAELSNMVSTISISNERASRTAYSASFTIRFDQRAVERWYSDNNIMNFLAMATGAGNRSLVMIDVGGLGDWARLKKTIRESGENFNLTIHSIFRGQATAYVATIQRRNLQNLMIANGWRATSYDGILRISRN